MFTNVNDAFNWMVSFTNLEKKPDLSKRGYRLDKMYKLLDIFNNPHLDSKFIHVAGSKGKGSTCAFISSILTEEGYKVGVYSSPHLLDYRERITKNHAFFSVETYLESINKIKTKLDSIDLTSLPGGEPTTFELMTLTAFIIFSREKCDWVVLETGIGGRIDSTNVVTPMVSVITQIELEHCDLLGDTLELIAKEKSGIIKENRPVFTSNTANNVLDTIKDIAKSKNSKVYEIPTNYDSIINNLGTWLIYENNSFKLGLNGSVQVINALLATEVVKLLIPEIKIQSIRNGLEKCFIPGRFQLYRHGVDIVVDGAHTKNSLINTVKGFKDIYKEGTIIFGVISGKDIESMIEIVALNFKNIVISKPGNFKHSDINDIHNRFSNINVETTLIESGKDALNYALSLNKPILVTGSFYMAGEIATLLEVDEK